MVNEKERLEVQFEQICTKWGFKVSPSGLMYMEPVFDFLGRSDQISNTVCQFGLNLNIGSTSNMNVVDRKGIQEIEKSLDYLEHRIQVQKRYLKHFQCLCDDLQTKLLGIEGLLEIIEQTNYSNLLKFLLRYK